MPVRFNPPPGWQVPPGFRPDSTWAPDPSWPPAPPGWDYWVDRPEPPLPDARDRAVPPAVVPVPPPASGPAGSSVNSPVSGPMGDTSTGEDTRTVTIQVIAGPTDRPIPPVPVDAMGSTMTMAPLSTTPPPPPDASGDVSADGSGTRVLAALKGVGGEGPGGKGSSASTGAPSAPQIARGPGPLSIDDVNRPRPREPVPHGQTVPGAVRPVAAVPGGPRPGAPGRRGGSRRPGVGLTIATGVACLALGVIIGVMLTAGQQAEAAQAISDAQNIQSQIDGERADIESERSRVEGLRDEVAGREKALSDREAQVQEQEDALKQQRQEQEEEEQEDEERNAGYGNGRNPGTVFYWNCDAVRAAGAAPLSSSQPGYLSHLDRNGNGVACEGGE